MLRYFYCLFFIIASISAPGADLPLKASWSDPATHQLLQMSFPGNFLIACPAGDTVTLTSTDSANFAAVAMGEGWTKEHAKATATEIVFSAPDTAGPYFATIGLVTQNVRRDITFCIFVPHSGRLSKNSWGTLSIGNRTLGGTYLNPYDSGAEGVKDHPDKFIPPLQFLQITAATAPLWISASLQVQDLVVPSDDTKTRHTDLVPANYALWNAYETIKTALVKKGLPPGALKILSVFRTPAYDSKIGSGKFSRHSYGDAFDFVVNPGDKKDMGDLNHDGKVDVNDGLWMVSLLEDLQADKALPIGGIGVYTFATGDFTVTMHVDLRGYRATWGFRHDARGNKGVFGWKSLRFAREDEAERQRKLAAGKAVNVQLLPLPSLSPAVAAVAP